MWGDRFYDNGEYIGHDEPDTTFTSSQANSGNNVTWNLSLGKDPTTAPTDATPGKDISHYFELTPAPWFSMALCDPNSYPQLPCAPESNVNAPKCFGVKCGAGSYPGGGGAFMEMQFYPPGEPPFLDNTSCDGTHWCASLTVDELMCTLQLRVVQQQLRGASLGRVHRDERPARPERVDPRRQHAPHEPR